MEKGKRREMGECCFLEGRRAAVAAADYEKHQQTQQWHSLTLLHTYTHREGDNKKRKKKKREERESAAFLVDINRLLVPMPPTLFSRLQLLFFFSRRCVYFFFFILYSLSFVRSSYNVRRRNDDINKTLSDGKNIIYITSTPKKDLRIS